MFTSIGLMLLLFVFVAFAIMVRETTELTPDSPFRLWVTRATVVAIVLWFAGGVLFGIAARYRGEGLAHVLLLRSVWRGIAAVVLILVVFRDEL